MIWQYNPPSFGVKIRQSLLFWEQLSYNYQQNWAMMLYEYSLLMTKKRATNRDGLMITNGDNPYKNNQKITNKNNDLSEFISAIAPKGDQRKIPPLDRWQPTRIHDFDIFIKDNGDWYHEGSKMTRQSLVDLFASVLWGQVENGQRAYFLKTPSDLYRIQVEDVPLFINKVDKIQQEGVDWIVFGTTNGDQIVLDDKPLYFKDFVKEGRVEYRLYLDTRFKLTARIGANVLYHLIEMGELSEIDGKAVLNLTSGGKIHSVQAEMSDD